MVLCFRRRVSDVSGSGGAGKFHEPGQKHLLGTLAQISWHANGTGSTWGCISVLRGNDRRPSFNRWTTSAGLGHLHWTLFRGRHRARRCRSRRARGTSTKSSGRTPIMSRRIRRPNYIDPIINSNNDRFRIVFYQGVVESRVCKVSLDLKRIRNTSRRDILGDLVSDVGVALTKKGLHHGFHSWQLVKIKVTGAKARRRISLGLLLKRGANNKSFS